MKKMRTVQKKNKNPKMASNRPIIEKWYTNIHGESVVKKMEGHKQNMKFLKPKVLYIPESWSEGIPASEIGIDAARISSTRRGVI